MNVTPSKLLLAFSLAAYGYCSWDHMFGDKPPPAPPAKTKELSADVVNPKVALQLARDPFDSIPLDRGPGGGRGMRAGGVLANEQGKLLGDLNLQAILVSPFGRTAIINGRSLREGQVGDIGEGQPHVRARRIGVDFVEIESGGGEMVILRLDDPPALRQDPKPAVANARSPGGSTGNPSHGTGNPPHGSGGRRGETASVTMEH